jgi:hypothetical protein
MLLMFFIFNVVLIISDIVTDFITAVNFFNDGHFYWAIFTIMPMFAPFVVRFSVALVELAKVSIRKVFFHLLLPRKVTKLQNTVKGNIKNVEQENTFCCLDF